VENGAHTSECMSNGFVVRLVLTLMIFRLCSAWIHAVHIESSFIYPSMRDHIVTALESTKLLGNNGKRLLVVSKELCYRRAETLGDAEEAARWWRYNLVR
jgi:hypothetical protein